MKDLLHLIQRIFLGHKKRQQMLNSKKRKNPELLKIPPQQISFTLMLNLNHLWKKLSLLRKLWMLTSQKTKIWIDGLKTLLHQSVTSSRDLRDLPDNP